MYARGAYQACFQLPKLRHSTCYDTSCMQKDKSANCRKWKCRNTTYVGAVIKLYVAINSVEPLPYPLFLLTPSCFRPRKLFNSALEKMSKFPEITRWLLAAGGSPSTTGKGTDFFYEENNNLCVKPWTGSQYADKSWVATGVKTGTSAPCVTVQNKVSRISLFAI